MPDGFAGAGYLDPITGEWVPTPGTGLNGIPQPTATATPGSGDWTTISKGGPIAIRTPNSSTGQPAFQAPSASQFQPPTTQTRPGLLTPNSSTGAPGYQVPTVNPMTLPVGGGLMTGVGALNAFPTPTPEQMNKTLNNPPLANDPWLIHSIGKLFGYGAPATQTQTQTAPAPPSGAPTATAAPPPPPNINLPPFNVPPPPSNLPPFNRGPIPAAMPQGAAPRAPRNYNLGYGGGTPAAAAAPPAAPSPMFTTIDRPNADIVGGPTRPGFLSASYDPATGSNRGAREPGGPARMSALDLSGLFNHPAVAAAAAAHPAVQGALAAAPTAGQANRNAWVDNAALGQQIIGNGWNAGGGRAPMVQPAGLSNKKFFGNPANWQYPNMPF